jgi:hypothetical protein
MACHPSVALPLTPEAVSATPSQLHACDTDVYTVLSNLRCHGTATTCPSMFLTLMFRLVVYPPCTAQGAGMVILTSQ